MSFLPSELSNTTGVDAFPDISNDLNTISLNCWKFAPEGNVLVLRDLTSSQDHRFAFFPEGDKNYGAGSPDNSGVILIHDFGSNWIAQSENGILCLRYTGTNGHRYAFWPDANQDFGITYAVVGATATIWSGGNWQFNIENGIFVFRNTANGKRYAFWPGNYVDM